MTDLSIRPEEIRDALQKFVSDYTPTQGEAEEVGIVASAADGIAGVLICLIALFFFLYEGGAIWRFLVGWLPAAARTPVAESSRRGWKSLSTYAHTQLAVAVLNAVGVGIGAAVLRVPFLVPIIVVVFLSSFVPIVGALVSGALPALLALVDRGPVIAAIMVAVVVVVHLTETHVLQPFLMGRAVALHPLAVIVVVAAATFLLGIAGALFAVPVTAMLNSIVRYLRGNDPFPELGAEGAVENGDGDTTAKAAATAEADATA